jgi:metal-sulfur cluster biosynthetic enzyme
MTQKEVIQALSRVEHPAIGYSLFYLGIVTDIELFENKVIATFVFPFPNIPIADALIDSIEHPLREWGLELEYIVRTMNNDERNRFLHLEAEAWKGR